MTPEELKLWEDRQQQLRSAIGSRLTMDDYFKVSAALAGLDSAGEKQVNAARIAMGDRGTFRMPSGGISGADVSKMMNIGDEEILNKIIDMQSQANLTSLKQHREWYTQLKLDPRFFEASRKAFRLAQGERRLEREEAEPKYRTTIRDGKKVPQVRNEASNWEWIDDPDQEAYPRFQESAYATYSDASGRRRFLEGPNIGLLVSEVAGLEKVEIETTKQQDFRFYIEQVNEARKIEGKEPLTDREEADIFNKFFLKEQVETSQAWTPPMIKEFSDKKTAFSDTTGMIKRMLKQLANPEVVIGTVASLFKKIEGIGSQFRQLARSFGDDDFIDPKQYDFGTAEYSGQLQANITGLAYTLAKAVEGGRLSESDVQLRINMITGGGMSKDTMTANLMELYNNSVRGMENAYLDASDAGLPGSTVRNVGEFLDSRKAGTLLIEPEIKGGKQTGIMALGYYDSAGKFHPITHWYDESQVQ